MHRTTGQVIHNDHIQSSLQIAVDDMRRDKSRASGNKNLHQVAPKWCICGANGLPGPGASTLERFQSEEWQRFVSRDGNNQICCSCCVSAGFSIVTDSSPDWFCSPWKE